MKSYVSWIDFIDKLSIKRLIPNDVQGNTTLLFQGYTWLRPITQPKCVPNYYIIFLTIEIF